MYSKFNLEISDYFYNTELNKHLECGTKTYDNFKTQAQKSLKEFIYENGHIDGTSMKSNWFGMERG